MNDRLIGIAQVSLSVLYTIGFFAILILFMLGFADVPQRFENAFTGLINLLTAAELAIIYFWFQRTRANKPEPTGDPANA